MEKMTFNLYKYILFAMGFVIAQLTIAIVSFIQQLQQYMQSYSPQEIAQVVEYYMRVFINPMTISVFVLLVISIVVYLIEFKMTKAYRMKKMRKTEPLMEKYELG